MPDLAKIPVDDAIAVPADPKNPLSAKLPKLRLGDAFVRWLGTLKAQVNATPARKTHLVVQGAHASIGTTPLEIPEVTQGIWRISVTVRVTTPGTVSSAIQVSILWTERGVVQIESTANLINNLTTTREGKTFIVRSDGANPISFAATYADGGGGTPMRYSLDIVAEELAADAA